MKKVVLFAAIGMLAFASCKQEYICECFDEEGGPIIDKEGLPIATTFLASQNNATDACDDYAALTDSTVICELQ